MAGMHDDLTDGIFAKQFEPDGNGYLFRAGQKNAPVRVTAVERDAFIGDYRRFNRRMTWIVVVTTILIIVVPVLIYDVVPEILLALAVVGLILVIGGCSYWSYLAPRRSLANRTAVGEPRTHAEMVTLTSAQTSWRLIIAMAAIGLFQTFEMFTASDRTSGWWFSLVGPFILAMLPIIIWRKLRS